MQEIDVGYTEYGNRNFLVMVDRLSSYIRCQETKDKTTTTTIKAMESWFEFHGYPERVGAGYSPAFRAGFNDWLEEMGMTREWPSPRNDPTKAAARRIVHIIKTCMNEGKDCKAALEETMNTPANDPGGTFPAQTFHQGHARRPRNHRAGAWTRGTEPPPRGR